MTKLPSRTILISGSTGFVGGNLLRNVEDKGFNILTLNKQKVHNGICWDHSPLVPEGVEIVVHLAGKAHDTSYRSLEEEYMAVNMELTKILYDSFLKSSARKFVFLSSVKAATDKLKEDQILTENNHQIPGSPYGRSKLAAEEYILKNLPDSKMKQIYILRPAMIHGPGNKGNLNLLYRFVMLGIPWPLGAYENKRSFCSLDNLLHVLNEIFLRNDITPGTYNVVDDIPLSTNRIIEIIAACEAKNIRILYIPKLLIKYLAHSSQFIGFHLLSSRITKLTENYVVSNVKLTCALGHKLPIDAEEGMLKTINSFKK